MSGRNCTRVARRDEAWHDVSYVCSWSEDVEDRVVCRRPTRRRCHLHQRHHEAQGGTRATEDRGTPEVRALRASSPANEGTSLVRLTSVFTLNVGVRMR